MKKKILIIEDDLASRKLERDILELSGYEIFEADNAKDGIDLAVKAHPDLIVMDIRLPSKKRGIGAAKILRRNELTSGIPIVFVTAYDYGQQSQEVKSIPNCGYITKPFDINTFPKEIAKFIK